MSEQLDKLCSVLDRLTLDALTLMEEQIQLKLEIESSMSEGEGHLAKSRYILGHKSVSELQLPTEGSPEFEAQAVVHSVDDEVLLKANFYDLEVRKKDENGEKTKDPLRWFGVLVPQNLHQAQSKFRQSLLWAVKCVNVQMQLNEVCTRIQQLKRVKLELSNTEE